MNRWITRPALAGLFAVFAIGIASAHQDKTIVYAMSNDATSNKVFAWRVSQNGALSSIGRFATHGNGTGTAETPGSGPVDGIDPLASQGSLTLSPNGHFLFAVNAGSASVSVFRVHGNGELRLTDVEPTHGTNPVSVTAWGKWVYVANVNDPGAGNPSTITGFKFRDDGTLMPIPHSTRGLSAPNARPSQVSIYPDGSQVVVTERETNAISVFSVHRDGTLSDPSVTPSPRPVPFGFDFTNRNVFVVSEAAAGDPAGSSASSFRLHDSAMATVISGGVLNGQMASCWTTASPNGTRAYVSNTLSNTVSTYAVAQNGTLSLRQAAAPTDGAGSAPIDAGISSNGRLFFQLLGGKGTIAVYNTDLHGDLHLIAVRATGLPTLGSQGLAVLE